MKIYFSASITDDEEIKNYYKKIISILESQGHNVLQYGSDHLRPDELLNRTDEQIEAAYKMLDKLMKQADMVVTEVSRPSIGVGYEISEAVSQKKPVLALSHKEADFAPLATLQGNKSKYIEYHQYTDSDIEGTIKSFTEKAKNIIDTKFILIISPEIDKYLEWVSQERRMHKAQIVRESIENQMLKDKEYQQFLKDL